MILEIASQQAIRFACLTYHYSKTIPPAQVSYSVFNKRNEFCGVIVYGHGANTHLAAIYNKWPGQVLELVRVALNGKQNTTSAVVGRSLRLLKKDAPLVDLIVSYADQDQNHTGTIYQASNWTYVGPVEEGQTSSAIIFGKKMHPRSIGSRYGTRALEWLRLNVDPKAYYLTTKGKHKYLKAMNKETQKLIEPLSKPYPKRIKQAMAGTTGTAGGQRPPIRSTTT